MLSGLDISASRPLFVVSFYLLLISISGKSWILRMFLVQNSFHFLFVLILHLFKLIRLYDKHQLTYTILRGRGVSSLASHTCASYRQQLLTVYCSWTKSHTTYVARLGIELTTSECAPPTKLNLARSVKTCRLLIICTEVLLAFHRAHGVGALIVVKPSQSRNGGWPGNFITTPWSHK